MNWDLNEDNAAQYYRQIQALRALADYLERNLIRYLREESTNTADCRLGRGGCRPDGKPGHRWRHISELTGVHTSRQAVQKKWKDLLSPTRRLAGLVERRSWRTLLATLRRDGLPREAYEDKLQ